MNVHSKPELTAAEEKLVAQFAARATDLPGDAAVMTARDRAMETLKRGLPTRKVEAWHYTDLRRLLSQVPEFDPSALPDALEPLVPGANLFTVPEGHADKRPDIEAVRSRRLRESLLEGGRDEWLAGPAPDDTVGALNQAFMSDGFEIALEAGARPESPIEIQNLHAGGQAHARFAVAVGEGARATFVERQAGTGPALVSSITHLDIGDGAEIVWVLMQEQSEETTHLGQMNVRIGRDARLTLFVMNAGGRLVRQEVRAVAAGEGSEFRLRGVNLLGGSAHCDLTMVLDHVAPGAVSTEIIRNVVTDRAEGAFQGQIRVSREAQKTDAKMSCNTLLLSDEAAFSAKPELEIFADDVACGHGATVTEIDENHLFYLMSRGVPEKEARGLLVRAFMAELIEELEDEALVEPLEKRLDAWFAAHG